MRSPPRAVACFALALAAACAGGCSTLDYYWQGVEGQYRILQAAKPLDTAIAEATDPRIKARLQQAKEIRAFASASLALPDNGSYRRYADLGRPYVLWNIFATPELSLQPREWCYPIAGCVNYRGYFNEAEARAAAARERAAGDDVYVGGVPAYSTLGWFDDPLLSTFIHYPQTEFARLVFHELAHQRVYAKGDTAFNESFAVTVEEVGLERWIAAQPADVRPRLEAERARSERLRREFRRMIGDARDELTAIYASPDPPAVKREQKVAVFLALRERYQVARAGDVTLTGYDRWFNQDGGPNNASVAAIALYTDEIPAFKALLAEESGDLPRFYARVEALAAMPRPARDAELAAARARAAQSTAGTGAALS
ncbi:MAG: aminopeptidase [Proteobacteria bacterium]|nr:aminopeptidase [Pseudomonadota bacterium]